MKSKIILALLLSAGLFGNAAPAQEAAVNNTQPANVQPDLDSLLRAAFPDTDPHRIWTGDLADKIARLPPAERNRIAVAAARGLSLRTASGDEITADTVDKLLYQSRASETPAQAQLRLLCGEDDRRMELLLYMENAKLITDPGVIEPLIDMLDFPGNKTAIPGKAAEILNLLTQHTWCVNDWYRDKETRQRSVAWWRSWWLKNHDEHPVFDTVLAERTRDRVATIAFQLFNDLQDYYELRSYLIPDSLSLRWQEDFFSIGVDSSVLQQGIMRTNGDGTWRMAKENDYISLQIAAQFATPPPIAPRIEQSLSRIKAPREEVLHEILPGTDVLISVHAASKDEAFMRRLRASLSKLPPAPESVEVARQQLASAQSATTAMLTQQLQNEMASFQAAETLIRLKDEAPVIGALTNASRIIRRGALYAVDNESVSEAAIAPLVSVLKSDDSELRGLALTALSKIRKGKETVIPVLTAMLQDADFHTRILAAQALSAYNVPAKTLLPVFFEFLSATNAEAREAALGLGCQWILTNDETAAVVSPLARLTKDPDARVRLSTVMALGQVMNKKLRGGAHPRDQKKANDLGDFAPHAKTIVSAMIESLSDSDAEVRAAAAYALGDMGPFDKAEDAAIVAGLIEAANDKDAKVRGRAVAALSDFK